MRNKKNNLGGLRGDACPPCLVARCACRFEACLKWAANGFAIGGIEVVKANGTSVHREMK